MTERLDVVAIGNAIVDVVASVEDEFLRENGVEKGVMTLIDQDRAAALYAAMPQAREISGGSAANTAAGLGAMGARAGFVGRVRDDQLGRIFAHDIRALGVHYDGPIATEGAETSRCLVLVSPDGERSMSTFLGASTELVPSDIDEAVLARAEWLYLEGYLYDTPEAKQAFAHAIRAVKAGGGRASLTVSDPFCVERHRADFHRLLPELDLLFANRAELLSLYQTEDLETALAAIARDVPLAAITLSGEGAIAVRGQARAHVPARKVRIVDTTGAGDLFAAGFLAGLVQGADDAASARMGCAAAAEIITHIGARPEADLAGIIAKA
ncbi:MAG TPA: adenosine kinase [Paracoccaceae bacterium]|nr:adenosine kinase [Paracoccaceae bacterium]